MSVYPPVEIHKAAMISDDGAYRYALHRWWGDGPRATFVMLNPSTADADQDDATIRRCVSFARHLDCDGIRVVNLYAFRATKPADLWRAEDPIGGQHSDDLLREVARLRHDPLIVAWGAHARADRVAEVLSWRGWDRAQSLGVTKAGAPRHPLYVVGGTPLEPWPAEKRKATR